MRAQRDTDAIAAAPRRVVTLRAAVVDDTAIHRVERQQLVEHEAVQAGQRAALASSIGFGIGLAGAAGVAALYFLARRPDARATAALRPTWFSARGGAGLGLEGSFR